MLRPRLTVCLLVLCLFWQALAFAGVGVAVAGPQEQEHALLHFEGAAHHHDEHDHSGLHQDESEASIGHMMSDCCLYSPALMSLPQFAVPQLAPERPEAVLAMGRPLPFLDGLERPPRTTA